MASQSILEMGFINESGKTQRIRVYDARESLTGAEVAAAMNIIIAKNIFTGSGGDLTGKSGASITTTEDTTLTIF